MVSDLNKHRFEYIWHLFYNNLTDIDIPFTDHIPCDPEIWQYPQEMIEYNKIVFEEFKNSLENKTVLDIGCGTAWYLGQLEGIIKKYTGIDPDSKSVKYANIMSKLVNVDAEIKLAYAEQVTCSADTIMMMSVTHKFNNVKPLFEKFFCENIILDSWDKLNDITLDQLILHIESCGFDLTKKTEFIQNSRTYFERGDRYILHFQKKNMV